MSNIVKELEEQIEIDKELIEVSPKTGIKQIRELSKILREMKERYSSINEALLKEMTERYDRINSIVENEEIPKTLQEVLSLDGLVLSQAGQTSFEKMGFDMQNYNLNGYYKKDLKTNNLEIYECIKKFREVGINVTAEDFDISEYTKEYMNVLIEEADKGEINSERVKDIFDKVYWKCSDLMSHILVNIRQIYDKNENEIDKYYKNKTEEVLASLNVTQKQVEDKKEELIKKLDYLKGIDGRVILDSFLDNTYNINDYRKNNYVDKYTNLISKNPDTLSENEKKEIDENVQKLNNNLIEYTNYLEFKFIIDDIMALKKEKEKEDKKAKEDKKNKKSAYELLQGEVKKMSSDIKKLNTEIEQAEEKKGLLAIFKKENKNKKALILERDNKILELKNLYAKFDNSKLKEKIGANITETSKILDVFKIASYYYGFLARSIIKKYPDIVDADIKSMIERFRKFVRLYHFSVINNVNINEKKDLSIVIKDKYKLLGLSISKENFQAANLEDLSKQTQVIDYYNHIQKSNIPIEDIQFVMNAKPILKR